MKHEYSAVLYNDMIIPDMLEMGIPQLQEMYY